MILLTQYIAYSDRYYISKIDKQRPISFVDRTFKMYEAISIIFKFYPEYSLSWVKFDRWSKLFCFGFEK